MILLSSINKSLVLGGLLFCLYCGNPKVSYYLTKVSSYQEVTLYHPNGRKLAKQPESKKIKKTDKHDLSLEEIGQGSNKESWILVYSENDISIWMQHANIVELEDYLEEIGFSSSSISRLPNIYYFRYYLKYKGSQPLRLNFFNSFFRDEFNYDYKPITETEFKDQFKSTFYSWIDYKKLHRIYIRKADAKGKKKGYEALNQKPSQSVRVTKGDGVLQIIGYPFLPLRSKQYDLFLRLQYPETIREIKISLYYLSSREDIPD